MRSSYRPAPRHALLTPSHYTGGYTLPGDRGNQAISSSTESLRLINSVTKKPEQTLKKRKGSSSNPVQGQKRTKFQDYLHGPPAISTPPPSPSYNLETNLPKRPSVTNPNLLVHACLYVLADKYDIKGLKRVTLQKIHTTFCRSSSSEKAYYQNVMDLVQYAYDNTACRENKDELRLLILHYIADGGEGSKAVARSKQCLDLIEEGGAFARDLMLVMLEDGN